MRSHRGLAIEDLAAWCVRVAKRAWIDDHRRQRHLRTPGAAAHHREAMDADGDRPTGLPDGLDDRLALLFVACDEALAPGAQMVLALRVVCGLSIAQTA